MNKFEELYKKGDYKGVIKSLELTSEPQELWLLIDAYIQLNQIDNAIRTIENNRDNLLNDDPKKTMFINIDLLLLKEDFVRALTTLSLFEELPYISIEIEELLPELKKYIYKKMNKNSKNISDEELIKNLQNFDNNELFLKSIYEIQKRDLKPFLASLKRSLVNPKVDDSLKTLILILLVEKRVDEEIKIIKDAVEYNVIPHYLDPIITMDEIEKMVYLHIKDKDVSILNLMCQLIAQYALSIYPDSFVSDDGQKELMYAFYLFAYEMFQKDKEEVLSLIKKEGLNVETVLALFSNIKAILQK